MNKIPIYDKRIEEISTDLDPWELFLPFSGTTNNVLLESSLVDRKLGRYSFIGISPFLIFISKLNKNEITYPSLEKSVIIHGNTFDVFSRILMKYSFNSIKKTPIYGGAIGYFAYEQFFNIEKKLQIETQDDLKLPDSYFCFYDTLIVFDHIRNKKYLIFLDFSGNNSKFENHIREVKNIILHAKKTKQLQLEKKLNSCKPNSSISKHEYENMVKKIREYIKAGHIYQACSTYRIDMEYIGSPQKLYQVLRKINPAPFSCYLNYPGFTILSSSPERFLRIINRHVQARPIKGTRPRGMDKREDRRNLNELKISIKDKAENVMIVDLLRNDIGRVCQTGTVRVRELFKIEKYATVFQMVSTIEGILDKRYSEIDCLKACFPGGSMTGAPKVRAMEIISELEKYNRGVYSGCIGYFSFHKNIDFNIVIRTIILKNQKAYFNVGGGIVYDSHPEAEYYESLDKARALIAAVNHAQNLESKQCC